MFIKSKNKIFLCFNRYTDCVDKKGRCGATTRMVHFVYFFQEEYISEGLQWSFIKYQDNQSCLDLIEGSPLSVFSLLNEVSSLIHFCSIFLFIDATI